jgi:hypothetical protein
MQISNTFVSIVNYTTQSIKSGLSKGASAIGSLGRFGVSVINSGASMASKTVRCSGRIFSNTGSFVAKGVAKHPKISITLGLIAGAAAVAVIAKKRFKDCCILNKLSAYNPFKGKKADDAKKAEVAQDEAKKSEVAKKGSQPASEADDESSSDEEEIYFPAVPANSPVDLRKTQG